MGNTDRLPRQPVALLISGLPRSGKTSLADALWERLRLTHVPLDRYIRRPPADTRFLEWVGSPACIDWPLLRRHVASIEAGEEVTAPSDWGPTWGEGGQQTREAGSGRVRSMRPSAAGWTLPGCYAFELPEPKGLALKVFVDAPLDVVAQRALLRPVRDEDVIGVLDLQLSANWREIESFRSRADVIVSGLASHEEQIETIVHAIGAAPA